MVAALQGRVHAYAPHQGPALARASVRADSKLAFAQ
jgi:hypothetical protein